MKADGPESATDERPSGFSHLFEVSPSSFGGDFYEGRLRPFEGESPLIRVIADSVLSPTAGRSRNARPMPSISTRQGDSGHTDLLFGQRVPKNHPRVTALGAVDEFNAALGLLRIHATTPEAAEVASHSQQYLIGLMGELATPIGGEDRYKGSHPQQIKAEHVAWLDGWVERLEREGNFSFKGWVLPGAAGVAGGAYADFARTVCRRAERCIVDLQTSGDELPNPEVVRFLNRLSDTLWLLARWEERKPE